MHVGCQFQIRNIILTVLDIRPEQYYARTLCPGEAGLAQSDLATLHQIQKDISKFSAIYAIGDNFVTTIKTVVSRKFGYCGTTARNFGGELDDVACRTVDTLNHSSSSNTDSTTTNHFPAAANGITRSGCGFSVDEDR